ncbi:MAG: serine--tRNA ligase, partial [Gemmatimonadota bacterium]
MLDLRLLRSAPETVKAALAKRGDATLPEAIDEVLAADGERRRAIAEVEELKAKRNEVSRRIGDLKRKGESGDALILEMREVGQRIGGLDEVVSGAEARIKEVLLGVPNMPLEEVPPGGEEDSVVVRSWGERPTFPFQPKPHWELGEALGILDLPRGAKISGSGFPLLRGRGARLQRGLIDYMLDLHTTHHGYQELRIPYLVTAETMTGT